MRRDNSIVRQRQLFCKKKKERKDGKGKCQLERIIVDMYVRIIKITVRQIAIVDYRTSTDRCNINMRQEDTSFHSL